MTGASPRDDSARRGASRVVKLFVGFTAGAMLLALAGSLPAALDEVSERPLAFAGFTALTCVLQLLAVRVNRGTIGVAGIGMLATGFALGVGPAMAAAVLAITVNTIRRRTPLHRAVFNASTTALAAAAGTAAFHLLLPGSAGSGPEFAAAAVAGVLFCVANLGLLTVVMSVDEAAKPLAIWRERFAWVTPYYLAFGVFALVATLAYEQLAFAAALAVIPPALAVLRSSTARRIQPAA